MSVHVIYYNKDRAKMMRPVLTREEYFALRNGEEQKAIVKAVRSGDTRKKSKLVQMNYSCLPNEDGTLKGSTTMSTTVGMDVDHVPAEQMQALRERILSNKDELGLLMLELSARGQGYHLVFRRQEGKSQEENLLWASQLIDVQYDEGAKDITRVFYTTTASKEDLIYLDDEVFDVRGKTEEVRGKMDDISSQPSDINPQTSYKGIPYSDIINEYWRRTGGVPVDGERNVRLHKLAVNLRAICENEPGRLLEVMPRLGLPESEVRAVVESACKEKPKGFTSILTQIVNDLQESPLSTEGAEGESLPPEMPKKLPKLIQLLISRTPDVYKPAVAHAVFPSLAAHLYKVRFRYIDNVLHEATLMNVLMAGTGAGKDCISQPINYIMADIRKRDEENLQREKQWKQEVSSKGANKDKRQRPEGLIIQEVDPDMTNPAFVMRMAEADGHFLYTKMNEIDQFDALRGSSKGSQQFQIMCLAFDPGNRYGQTRVGTGSVTEKVCIRFNWNAATTINKGQRYFRNVLTDGPISRINFCTIPEREIGAEMPVYGTYDAAFEEELRPYIEKLTKAVGEVNCPQAFKLAQKMVEENAEFARLSQSRVYENLSFRANVIAWLKGCLLFVANDCKWDKSIEDFVRWSLQYDMWCKMQFFGEAIEHADYIEDKPKSGPRNLLELLPDEFTLQDAINVRRQQGMDAKGTRKMINTWKQRSYIQTITESGNRSGNGNGNSYQKLKFKN